jgi:ubiquinone/menaquinone biosynthesis C-methylase UbiE
VSNPRAKVTANLLLRFGGRIDRIIELGVGNASILIEIAKMVGATQLYGLDINDKALEESRRKGITTIKAVLNIDTIPHPDDYFDA